MKSFPRSLAPFALALVAVTFLSAQAYRPSTSGGRSSQASGVLSGILEFATVSTWEDIVTPPAGRSFVLTDAWVPDGLDGRLSSIHIGTRDSAGFVRKLWTGNASKLLLRAGFRVRDGETLVARYTQSSFPMAWAGFVD